MPFLWTVIDKLQNAVWSQCPLWKMLISNLNLLQLCFVIAIFLYIFY